MSRKGILPRFLEGTLPPLVIVLTVVVTACSRQFAQVNAPMPESPTPTLAAKALFEVTLPPSQAPEEAWPTPLITATPVHVDVKSVDELDRLFSRLYFFTPCRINMLVDREVPVPIPSGTPGLPVPEFLEIDALSDPYMQSVVEIASNDDATYQAFVACENTICHPKIFFRAVGDPRIYEINWQSRLPWRPIDALIWISHSVVAFAQSNNPMVAQILAVDVEKREFVYYSLVYADCPLPSPTP